MFRKILAQFGGLILFLIIINGSFSEGSRIPFQYQECNPGESLIDVSTLWVQGNGLDGWTRLDNTGVWTASVFNSTQFLIVDVGAVHIMTSVNTQGRQGSDEYVAEFTIEFSMDNKTWEKYANEFGLTEIFKGNEDENTVKENTLMYPVIARYIKVRPIRWNKHISMRLDVIGCLYVPDTIQTGNGGYIVYDGTDQQSIPTEADVITLRFRTTQEDGVLLYAGGDHGDFILMELRRGQLHLIIDLGSTVSVSGVTPVAGRSFLNDGKWHNVIVQRNGKNAKLTVDRRETQFQTRGIFFRFNNKGKVYLGGLDYYNKRGVTNIYGFNGCIDFVRYNGINLIKNVKDRVAGYQVVGLVEFTCSLETGMSLSFTNSSSLEIPNADTGDIRVTFQFRTLDKSALILRHQMLEPSDVLVGTDHSGFVYYKITDRQNTTIEDVVQIIDVEGNIMELTDGLWHTFDIIISRTKVNVTVDRHSRVTNKQLDINSGQTYIFGGNGVKPGFRGCVRNIEVGSTPIDLANLSPDLFNMVSIGSCDINDKCFPNPCEHNGKCSQDWDTFYCKCGSTGYSGAVCHTSAHPLSCAVNNMYEDMNTNNLVKKVKIDPDGSGPIDPFTVTCREPKETWISHNSMGLITVDGYQVPDYYIRRVEYDSDLAGITEVIERSTNCKQEILWKCNNSRLMARTVFSDPNMPHTFGYWVGRTYQNMYNWGGTASGSYKCACGVTEKGCVSGSTTCNCDSYDEQVEDGGLLTHKEFLPVLELHFGDTGTLTDNKIGQFKLGELKCSGENMLDNVVTFRKTDATLEFATFEDGKAGDIWFQFKTTATDGVMIHDTGDTEDIFIQIRLTDGDTIQYRYNIGNGIQVLEYRTNNTLNNDIWHTVHVERNRKQAWLRVDNFPEEVRNEPQDEIIRLMDLTKPLTVGAAVDHRDGFVGCMRGLRVNGVLMDMRGAVRKGQFTYGVHEGCVGKCASNPCFNQGTCREGYSHYTCDCTFTPFGGRMCFREVGVNMQTNFMIQYEFDEKRGFPATDFMYIRVGFITKKKQGILIQVRNERNTEYISLEMNNNGGVKFFLDVGFERWELNTGVNNIDLTNGQAHEVILRREQNGREVYLQVDNYETAIAHLGWGVSDTMLDDPKYLFIGNNDTENTGKGFEGCIYRMQIDNIYPLKRAFQDPRPSFIKPVPEVAIHKGTCGFGEVTRAPDPVEERVYSLMCGNPVPAPVEDRGGKTLTDGDVFFSFSLLEIVFNNTEDSNITNTTEPLTMSCRVTSADINVIYYILIQQETSPGSGEFECLAMIESGGMQIPKLFDNANTEKGYIVNGTLDRALVANPYLSISIDVLNLTANDAKDYVCEVAYKNSSTEVFEKAATISNIISDNVVCLIQEKLQSESSQDEKSSATKIGIAVGVTVGVVTIIAVVAAIVVFYRRRRKSVGLQLHSAELSALSTSNPDSA